MVKIQDRLSLISDEHVRDVASRAIQAIDLHKCLILRYDQQVRIIEVHAVGISTAGKPCMRVYQIEGGSLSGQEQGWKMMSLGKIEKLPDFYDISSLAPRKGYHKGDLGMKGIIKEI